MLAAFGRRRAQDGPEGLGDPALLADHLADVIRGDPELKNR